MITVVGIAGCPTEPGRRALARATLVVGSSRLLAQIEGLTAPGTRTLTLTGDLGEALDAVGAARDAGDDVCVVGSGDPGWFGIVRVLAERFGPAALDVHPGPSSVALAFARLGIPWDDAVVVSAHGRPAESAARTAALAPKAAVLTSPESTPAHIGRLLAGLGAAHEHAAIAENLGDVTERVTVTDLAGLAAGEWDPLAVVALWSGSGVAAEKSRRWGRPETDFTHRASMITKSEVRSVVIGLLELPAPADGCVLWDVGAGSGSVAVECASLAPGIEAIAVERDPDAAETCRVNARAHHVALRVCTDEAPRCFDHLPAPHRVFVGGGGMDVLRAARARLEPGGVIVASFAAIDRAAQAADLLGNLTQLAASRGRRLPDGGWRLDAANPTFVAWGSSS